MRQSRHGESGQRRTCGRSSCTTIFHPWTTCSSLCSRRRSEQGLELASKALQRKNPLKILWEQNSDRANATLHLEFMALANHRKALRAEFVRYGDQLRRMQYDALVRHYRKLGIEPEIDLGIMTFLMASVPILLTMESEMGMSFAHAKVRSSAKSTLKRLGTAAGRISSKSGKTSRTSKSHSRTRSS